MVIEIDQSTQPGCTQVKVSGMHHGEQQKAQGHQGVPPWELGKEVIELDSPGPVLDRHAVADSGLVEPAPLHQVGEEAVQNAQRHCHEVEHPEGQLVAEQCHDAAESCIDKHRPTFENTFGSVSGMDQGCWVESSSYFSKLIFIYLGIYFIGGFFGIAQFPFFLMCQRLKGNTDEK